MLVHDFYIGTAFDAYNYFGAHLEENGVTFRVYAPSASKVSVIGEFNDWQDEWMQQNGQSGIFEYHSDKAKEGMMYKYRVYPQFGSAVDKTDPYAFGMELRPNSASIIRDIHKFKFKDEKWMKNRSKNYDKPMNIYEVHFGSWKKPVLKDEELSEQAQQWYTYRELARPLIQYVKENHYTHIEFMPLSEHPADCSWGYQVTGFYSPTSRYGTAQDLQYLVNECHKAGIGVIMDFVPVHFAMDYYSLSRFDGTPLYEYPEREKGYSEWGSCNFNYYRGETRSFLQSAAAYWLDVYHCDGVRMDAISNVIYWQGNQDRGVNTGALDFIKEMNAGLQSLYPTAMLIAEDSSAFPKVTAPVSYDGLGFDYKWDMGWMNDTLDFFKLAPWERSANYHKLTFSMMYFYNELFILPFSHDEVVHGKATIMQKMWGEYEQKFSQCRLLYLYMFSHPGKKLNFMGNEWGQLREWDETREQDWSLLEYPNHDAFHRYMVDLNKLYVKYDALYDEEYNPQRFQWLQVHGEEHCVYIYQRKGKEKSLVVAMNMTDVPREDYQFAADEDLVIKEIFNSDTDYYGGTTPMPKRRNRIKAVDGMMTISLAPFSGKIYEVCQPTKKKPAKKLSANTDQ